MALKIKPPTHRADALGVFISKADTAWNNALINEEVAVLQAKALAEVQAAAALAYKAKHPTAPDDEVAAVGAATVLTAQQNVDAIRRHPTVRYMRGVTRYQPSADDWRPDGTPCTVRDYLKPGAAEFTLRRLPYAVYQACDAIEESAPRLTAFARASLRAVSAGDYTWTADDKDNRAPEAVIQVLHDADVSLPLEIGMAVISLCRPPDDAETFR